jgi:hypothetical protein
MFLFEIKDYSKKLIKNTNKILDKYLESSAVVNFYFALLLYRNHCSIVMDLIWFHMLEQCKHLLLLLCSNHLSIQCL